jgi:hypothetical protein
MRLAAHAIRSAVGPKVARSMEWLVTSGMRPLLRRARPGASPPARGRRFCVIHLDGVSRQAFLSAIASGDAPFLGRLLHSGAYAFSPCYSGAPASTPAFQAGLLYGQRSPDIPGYHWYDRQRRTEVGMDRAEDAAAVEAKLMAQGPGLLEHGSASFSIFSGGAKVDGFSMAGWAARPRLRILAGLDPWYLAAGAVAHSRTAARIAGRVVREGGAALFDLIRQSAQVGRLQHEPGFFLRRVGLSIGAREAAIFGAALSMAQGVPANYICFGDYDEIAHRRGPDAPDACEALRGIDRAVAHIFAAAAAVPELGYDLYVVSDHGQVRTLPFEGATGLGLLDYLALAVPGHEGAPEVNEEAARQMGRLRALGRIAQSLPSTLEAKARALAGEMAHSIAGGWRRADDGARLLEEAVCVDAGDIAHLYLGRESRPLTEGEIAKRYPRLLAVVTRCPAVGMVAVRSERGAVAYRNGRRYELSEPASLSRAFDLGYGAARAAAFVSAVVGLPSAGDLVVYGNGLPSRDVAFSWEFGSHAGVASDEVETFVLHPKAIAYDFTQVAHGADLHDFLIDQYGVPGVAPPRPAASGPEVRAPSREIETL